jgi:hypothetical protein
MGRRVMNFIAACVYDTAPCYMFRHCMATPMLENRAEPAETSNGSAPLLLLTGRKNKKTAMD